MKVRQFLTSVGSKRTCLLIGIRTPNFVFKNVRDPDWRSPTNCQRLLAKHCWFTPNCRRLVPNFFVGQSNHRRLATSRCGSDVANCHMLAAVSHLFAPEIGPRVFRVWSGNALTGRLHTTPRRFCLCRIYESKRRPRAHPTTTTRSATSIPAASLEHAAPATAATATVRGLPWSAGQQSS